MTDGRSLTVRVLRVFTRDGRGGNPLGVHDGLLPNARMARAATALGYSETIFVDRPAADGTVGVRIFTPTSELPFAGHPLVGATWHLAAPGAAVGMRCGIGVVTGRRADAATAEVDVEHVPTVRRTAAPGAVAAWEALMPLPYEILELGSPAEVAAYTLSDRPDHRLVWAAGDDGDPGIVRARFFAPGLGVEEDPATGSAAVALAAVRRHEGAPSGELTVHQGAEIGAPSRIYLSWTPATISIGGSVEDDGERRISVPAGS
jgi:predicted PhzF superfamily epimerase YddE/YHI9